MAYSSFVLATMVPILWELWEYSAPGYSRLAVMAFYAPWALFPLLILLKTAFSATPFTTKPARDPWGDVQKHKWI